MFMFYLWFGLKGYFLRCELYNLVVFKNENMVIGFKNLKLYVFKFFDNWVVFWLIFLWFLGFL